MFNILNYKIKIYKDKNGIYAGYVPSLKSCYTQAKNLKELKSRLQEVVMLSLETKNEVGRTSEFMGKNVKSYAKTGANFTS